MLKSATFVIASFLTQIFIAFFIQWFGVILPPSQLPVIAATAYINSVEIFFNLIAIFLCGIWIFDLRRSSLMHINLKFVCYLISFHISTFCFLETILYIDKFTNNKYLPPPLKLIIDVIHGSSRIHFTMDPAIAAIERGLATLKVTNYETATSSKKQWITVMFIKEMFGVLIFYIFSCTTAGAVLFGLFWIFLLIVTVIIAILLYRVNLRSYKTRIGTLHLTTRYQTVENIRCLKPVLIYSFLAIIQNILAFILLLFMVIYYRNGDIYAAYIIEATMSFIVSIFCIFVILSFLGYSSRIRKIFKNKIKSYQISRVTPSSNAAVASILSVMGKVLTSENEQNLYFHQLNKSWN